MTRPQDNWMVCAVCGRVLERLGGHEWLHPTDMRLGAGREDHRPVPVSRTDAKVVLEVCDFCFEPNPPWELPTRNFAMPPGVVMSVSTSGWACCDICAELIRADMWTQLSNRAIACHERREGKPMSSGSQTLLRRIYRSVRRNVVGPVQENNPRKDKDYGDEIVPEAPDVDVTSFSGDGTMRMQEVRKRNA